MTDRNSNQFDLYISVWVNIKFHIIGGHFEVLHSKWKKTRWSFGFGCYATLTRCQMPALYCVGHQTVAICRLGEREGWARQRERESNVWAEVGAWRSREGAACWECARWSATCSQHDFLSPAHGPESSLANKTREDSKQKVREKLK